MSFVSLAPGLWIKSYTLSVLGTQHGRNVTLIKLTSGQVVVHSMAPFSVADVAEIKAAGPTGWLLEAILFHDTYARKGKDAFPEVPFLGPPGFEKVVGFPVQTLSPAPEAWAGELEVFSLAGAPGLEEQVILHVPSRTLIVADLIFNFNPDETGWDRFFHRHIAGFRRYPGMSRIFKLFIKDREAFRRSLEPVLAADFDRVIVGHGAVIPSGGKVLLNQALQDAGLL